MGELIQNINYTRNLTVVTGLGIVTADEIITAIEEFYRDTPTRFLLFDFSDADTSNLTAENLRNIAHVSKRAMHSRNDAKTAVVVSGEAAYGMGRMFETFVELEAITLEFNIFRDYQAAIDWIFFEDK